MKPFPDAPGSYFLVAPADSWEWLYAKGAALVHQSDCWPRVSEVGPVNMQAIRALYQWCSRAPQGDKRLAWVFLADAGRSELANAVLRLTETPPEDLILIICAERDALLPTLASRLIRIESGILSAQSPLAELVPGSQSAPTAQYLLALAHPGMNQAALRDALKSDSVRS